MDNGYIAVIVLGFAVLVCILAVRLAFCLFRLVLMSLAFMNIVTAAAFLFIERLPSVLFFLSLSYHVPFAHASTDLLAVFTGGGLHLSSWLREGQGHHSASASVPSAPLLSSFKVFFVT
jgi:hypothetical protein